MTRCTAGHRVHTERGTGVLITPGPDSSRRRQGGQRPGLASKETRPPLWLA